MRIVAGSLRGRRLVAPAGIEVRPTPDKVREALFDILGAGVSGSRFLDLFAGSGAVGIEALSRGAASVTLVESSLSVLRTLDRNVESLGLERQIRIVRAPWPRALQAALSDKPYTHVFADPPYARAPYPEILESLSSPGLLSQDAAVVLEHENRHGMPDRAGTLERVRVARYGRVGLAFFRLLSPVAFPESGS